MTGPEPVAAVMWSVAVLTSAVGAAAAVPQRRIVPRLPGTPDRAADRGSGDPARETPWLRLAGTAGVALGAAALVGGPVGGVVAMAAAAVCWRVSGRLEPPAVRRRRERLIADLPHVVDLMAACLAAGLSPAAAVEQIGRAVDGPMRDELQALSARLRLGVDPATAWRDVARHPQLGAVGRSVHRAVDTGSSVADAMVRLAEDLRRRRRSEVESRARTVGVKAAVPLGVCLLPAFVLVGVVPLVAGSVAVLVHR